MLSRYSLPENKVFGRNEEIEVGVETLLNGHSNSFLTLTGHPGSGKTRLALEIASRLESSFDAVYFVPVSDLTSAEELVEGLERALPIQAGSALGKEKGVGKSLYVLDQFDVLGKAGAHALKALLENRNRQFLVTSRHPLALSGECVLQVLPLEKSGNEDPAKSLLLYRVRESVHSAWANGHASQDADELCSLLEGLPLAVEVFAGAASSLALRDAVIAIRSSKEQPSGGDPSTPQRKALNASIEFACDTLTPEQRSFLGRLSVFKNEITVQSARFVCPSDGAVTLLPTLHSRYLVAQYRAAGSAVRYRLPDAIREFLWDRLSGGERAALRTNHAYFFLHLAESWPSGAELEHANFATALQWCVETENVEMGLRLAYALRDHWQKVGAENESRRWLKRLLSIPDATVPALVTERAHATLSSSGPAE